MHQVVRLFERGLAVAGAVLGACDIWVVLEISAAEALRTDPVVIAVDHLSVGELGPVRLFAPGVVTAIFEPVSITHQDVLPLAARAVLRATGSFSL